MSTHRDRYLAELRSANEAIEKADALVTDPDDPQWRGVDPTRLDAGFVDYYTGLVQAGYYNGFI